MVNGSGERIWRPLNNPKTLQVSAFMDSSPKGFGFWQRDRSFSNFEDLEAHYERRPSVWVEPNGSWGDGFVELIEIPANDEIYDNVVAYWKPATDLASRRTARFCLQTFLGRGRATGVVRCPRAEDQDRRRQKAAHRFVCHRSNRSFCQRGS